MAKKQATIQTEVSEALEMLGEGYEPGFSEPLHTQTPNDFFDYYLQRIDSLAELKVICAFIRQSFGWHRLEFELGIQEIAALIGMSRRSATDGVQAAEARGLVRRVNPGSHKRAKWEMVVTRRFYATVAQTLRDTRADSTRHIGVKERKKVKEGTTPPEVMLFRTVTEHFPSRDTYKIVTDSIQQVGARLGRMATAEDLLPFWTYWRGKGWSPRNLAWLTEWAVAGKIPDRQNGHTKQIQPPAQQHKDLDGAIKQAKSLLEKTK